MNNVDNKGIFSKTTVIYPTFLAFINNQLTLSDIELVMYSSAEVPSSNGSLVLQKKKKNPV